MGPFVVRLDTQFGRGVTDIVLPPLGHLTANTHSAPLRLSATLLDVRISELTRELSAGGIDGLVARVQSDSGHALPLHAFRAIAVAGFGALLLGALAFRTRWVPLVTTILIAMSLVGGSEILALATFRSGAFATPTFSGSLALAADIIPPVRSAATKFDEFRAQLERVVDGAIKVYTSIQTSPVGEAGEIRVLHISDIHLSPLGLEFAKQISDGFDVDFIVDTGDTTSFGTPPENVVLNDIASMGRPYVWVRGNHDSRAFQEAMEKLPNAIVLDGTTTELDGIRLYGKGDPIKPPTIERLSDAVFESRVLAVDPFVLSDVERRHRGRPRRPHGAERRGTRAAGHLGALPRERFPRSGRHPVPPGGDDRRLELRHVPSRRGHPALRRGPVLRAGDPAATGGLRPHRAVAEDRRPDRHPPPG